MAEEKQAPVRSPDRLKLLVTIVNRSKSEYYADFIQSQGVDVQYFVSAQGTSTAEMLELIGLADDRKSVILGVVQAAKSHELLLALEERFRTVRNGKGIAFTVPVASVIGVTAFELLSNLRNPGRL